MDAVLAAALEYLRYHIAMEILSRGKCAGELTVEQFGVPAFGTAVFLEEISGKLASPYVDTINTFVRSIDYKTTLQMITQRIYEQINVADDRSKCPNVVNLYRMSFYRSKEVFLSLLKTTPVCEAPVDGEDGCTSKGDPDQEENSN